MTALAATTATTAATSSVVVLTGAAPTSMALSSSRRSRSRSSLGGLLGISFALVLSLDSLLLVLLPLDVSSLRLQVLPLGLSLLSSTLLSSLGSSRLALWRGGVGGSCEGGGEGVCVGERVLGRKG